ncbi:MAG: long-chain fatty acid--CoA ligase, partial [bacterium]|nr:long-chain fatty acid--CoA ligase [bacterium]
MIIERFEQHVKNNPGKLAVKSAARTLTYNELNRLSKAVAAKIESLSDGIPKGAVGIMSDEPAEMIAGILGILRSGNIYVPMVNDFPPKRLAYIIRHAGTRLIVADQKNRERILTACDNPGDTRFILTEELESVGDDMNSNTGQTQTREVFTDTGASLLFTSGSTGFPKGVLQTHRNISYFIDRYTQNLGVTSSDNMTLFASFSHDVTLLDMYSSLLSGATLFPLDLKEDDVFASLPQWLETRKITVWHSVPTVYRYFIAGLSGPLHLPHIRRIVLGGEAVTESDIEKFNNYFDHCPQCQLYTLYGQTESSYNSGSHYPPGAPTKDITITLGDINTGTEMFIVDEKGGEVEALETGEIIVQGHHISPGYWKDEEK